MDSIATWFAESLGQYIPAEIVIFIVSMMPILEVRGGLIVASLLQVNILTAIPICVIGNLLPIPFLLLFINVIFKWLKNVPGIKKVIIKLEDRAMKKSGSIAKGEFIGLMLFVGIPLPGTGAWTGSLVASMLKIDFKKAIVAELIGVFIATVIMAALSYGLLEIIF